MSLASLTLLLLAAAPTAEDAAALASKGSTVRCTIRSPDDDSGSPRVVLDGPCRFLPEGKGGSFSLAALDERAPLYPGILTVTVSVTGPGKAEVRGLTAEGIASRWGEARRSKADPACWTGSDFEVCARRGT